MTIITRITVLFLALFCFLFTAVSAAQEMPPKAKALIDNLLLEAEKSAIWPDYNPLSGPVAVHFKGRGSYLIGAAGAPKGCAPIKGFSRPVWFFRNKAADGVLSHFSAVYHTKEAGNVFLYNYDNGDLLPAELTIVHETFHLFQHSAFKDASPAPLPAPIENSFAAEYRASLRSIWDWLKQLRLPEKTDEQLKPDTNDIALAYVEDKLLAQALLDRRNYRTPAAEFVRMRDYRRGKLSSRLLELELKQEMIEGTAEYAGWKSIAEHFSPLLAENYQAGMLLSPQPLANSVRRFYSPGAAQGFLLDRLGVRWKQRVQNGEDIFTVMREFFPPDKKTRNVGRLMRNLYSGWVKRALTAQARELRAKREGAIARVKKYSGWRLVLHKDMDCDSSATCYDEAVDLGDGTSYQEACHTVMQGKGLDILIDKPVIQAAREITVLLGTAPNFELSLDDVMLPGVPAAAAFNKLRLRTEGLTLDLNLNGRVKLIGKTISIEPSTARPVKKRGQ